MFQTPLNLFKFTHVSFPSSYRVYVYLDDRINNESNKSKGTAAELAFDFFISFFILYLGISRVICFTLRGIYMDACTYAITIFGKQWTSFSEESLFIMHRWMKFHPQNLLSWSLLSVYVLCIEVVQDWSKQLPIFRVVCPLMYFYILEIPN